MNKMYPQQCEVHLSVMHKIAYVVGTHNYQCWTVSKYFPAAS